MAQEQLEQDEKNEQSESDEQNGSAEGGHGGLKTAAAASVAAGVSYLVAKRALDQRGGGDSGSGGGSEGGEERKTGGSSGGGGSRKSDSLRSAVDVLTRDRAQEMLLPMAERAASAVGTYVARETPDIVSDRLVPRFIDAFNKARSKND